MIRCKNRIKISQEDRFILSTNKVVIISGGKPFIIKNLFSRNKRNHFFNKKFFIIFKFYFFIGIGIIIKIKVFYLEKITNSTNDTPKNKNYSLMYFKIFNYTLNNLKFQKKTNQGGDTRQ